MSITGNTYVENLLILAANRGVEIQLVDDFRPTGGNNAGDCGSHSTPRLRVAGPPAAVATIKPHLLAVKDAVIAELQWRPQTSTLPVARSMGGQGGKSAGQQSPTTPPLTPLAVLAARSIEAQRRPTEAEIDLALWLTDACRLVAEDYPPLAGAIIPRGQSAALVRPTIASLAAGPGRSETIAEWTARIGRFKSAIDDPSTSWRGDGFQPQDWPADPVPQKAREPTPLKKAR